MDAKSRGRLVLALSYAETREWEPVGVCGECGQSLNARWRLQRIAQHLRRVLAEEEAEALAHSEGEVTP